MINAGIVVHGGVGSPAPWADGCRRAALRGQAALDRGGCALDAVVEAAVDLEDDGRFNAGRGSQFRLDGTTIEMDAALMASDGRLGTVAAIRRVKNPILVAREVMKTPHVMLAADGAVAFARRCGFADYYEPQPAARERYERVRTAMKSGKTDDFRDAWRGFDVRKYWNFTARYEEVFACPPDRAPSGAAADQPARPSEAERVADDTIGAVAIDKDGLFAVANSTGGASPMLAGRVGDSPIIGCGFYAGPSAAVAATGIGEEIVRRMLCRQVHDWIAHGEDVARACERGVAQYPREVPIGLVAISRRGTAAAHNRDMAFAEARDER